MVKRILFVLLLTASLAGAVTISRQPYLSMQSPTGMTVTFETLTGWPSTLRWATQAYYDANGGTFDNTLDDGSWHMHHVFTLTGLTPWTRYVYQAATDIDQSPVRHFRTAPTTTQPFCFVAYGDTRTNLTEHGVIANRAAESNPDLVFNSGDLITDGSTWVGSAEWSTWFSSVANLAGNAPYYISVGNHESTVDAYFRPNFEFPGNEQWYSFDYSNCHFIVLNNCADITTGSAQLTFLQSDLAAASGHYAFTFVFFHQPPYTTGSEHSDDIPSQTYLVPLFEAYGVTVVFNGHNHDYERNYVNGIWYIVTGGGGAPLYGVGTGPFTIYSESSYHYCTVCINGDSLHFEAHHDDGGVFDSFDLPNSAVAIDASAPSGSGRVDVSPTPFHEVCRITGPPGEHVGIYDLNGVRWVYSVAPFDWRPAGHLPSGVYLLRTDSELPGATRRVMYIR